MFASVPPGSQFRELKSSRSARRIISVCFFAGLGLIVVSLWLWGAAGVRGDFGSVLFLTAVGVGCLQLAKMTFPWLGLSIRDDAVDRRNPSAVIALGSALISVAVIYAAGNLGEGLSYSENFFSAALGLAGWVVAWLALEQGAEASVSIAEERDLGSGIRFGGFLLSVGLIFARAVAGDWHSGWATVHDFFRDGYPAWILTLVALWLERGLRPSRRSPFPCWITHGILPALGYLLAAAIWLHHLGKWEGMPI